MRSKARTLLWSAVAGLIGWGLAVAAAGPVNPILVERRGADLELYRAINGRVAQGEDYYRVLADELPARDYATRSVFNWRLPTLAWLNARLPGRAFLGAVGATLVVAWVIVIWRTMPHSAVAAVIILTLGTLPQLLNDASVMVHEVWAGLLMAASLACWGLRRWKTSVTLGTASLMIRELALPYVAIMAGVAWWEGRRREALTWLSAVGISVAFWAWHFSRVVDAMPPQGQGSSWFNFGGWGFVLDTSQTSPLLTLIPHRWNDWILAVLVPVLWAGCWYWRDALGRRLALVLGAYFALFTIAGRPDNWYWGFLISPLIPLGGLGYFFERPPRHP